MTQLQKDEAIKEKAGEVKDAIAAIFLVPGGIETKRMALAAIRHYIETILAKLNALDRVKRS
jgi:hypothetical protein